MYDTDGTEKPVPQALASDVNDPLYHPCYILVGVRINGEERNDIIKYDVRGRLATTRYKTLLQFVEIEPYWRARPSRQVRRQIEQWEKRHGKA